MKTGVSSSAVSETLNRALYVQYMSFGTVETDGTEAGVTDVCHACPLFVRDLAKVHHHHQSIQCSMNFLGHSPPID